MSLLSEISYYKTGGSCHKLFLPESVEQLSECLAEMRVAPMPTFFLGMGSNSLVSDEYWDGYVVAFKNLNKLKLDGKTLICDAGVSNVAASEQAISKGFTNLAWMSCLPGQIGGTVRMNARCYGGEISQIASKVHWFDGDGKYHITKGSPQVFKGYKDTLFMENGGIVARAEFNLREEDLEQARKQMSWIESDRTQKGQFSYPTCGCVFKNNYDPEISISSGFLLEQSYQELEFVKHHHGAEVSPYHANFVYNKGATSREILELTLKMRHVVWECFGVWLEYEMEILGTLPRDLSEKFYEKRPHQLKTDKLRKARELFKSNLR